MSTSGAVVATSSDGTERGHLRAVEGHHRSPQDWGLARLCVDVDPGTGSEPLERLGGVAVAAAEALGHLGTEAWSEADVSALCRAAGVLATCAATLSSAGESDRGVIGSDGWAPAVAFFIADRVLAGGPPVGAVATIRWLARETAGAARGRQRLVRELRCFYERLVPPAAVAAGAA